MPPRQNLSFFSVVLVLLVGVGLGVQLTGSGSFNDDLEQFEKMRRTFVIISGKYVEPVNAETIAEGGVRGMLDRLDPYSRFVPSEAAQQSRARYRGSFGGVGIQFDVLSDTAQVLFPLPDGPSDNAGVRPGDRLIEIEGRNAVGVRPDEIRNQLTGTVGTPVTFTIHRPSSNRRHTITVKRSEISLPSIHAAHMIDARTGYVKIDRFSHSTPDEFRSSARRLKENGLQRLILDLRGNEGGTVQSAVEITGELIGTGGSTVVETKGRSPETNRIWRAERGGLLEHEPVIVLVDGRSASASEILAGALQDHDRALLVGRRTFGKALVQKPFELSDGSVVHLTVGRYYTPVGRLIQKPYDNVKTGHAENGVGESGASLKTAVQPDPDEMPDSLTYTTRHERTVFGGGGILPDVIVRPDTHSLEHLVRLEISAPFFSLFASEWFARHERTLRSTWQARKDDFLTSYETPPEAVSAFWAYLQREGVLTLTSDTDAVDPEQQIYWKGNVDASRAVVQTRIKAELADVMYGPETGRPLLTDIDPTLNKALTKWPQSEELAAHHRPSTQQDGP